MKKILLTVLKETLVQMIISVVLIAMAAFVVLRISPPESTIKIIILVIYAISALVGGIILGKVMEKRKFLWGALAGGLYFAIILLVALIVKGSPDAGTIGITSGIIVSIAAGTIGGMIG